MKSTAQLLIESFVASNRLSEKSINANGILNFVIDNYFRIRLYESRSGHLVIHSKLYNLPSNPNEKDSIVVKIGRIAQILPNFSLASIVIDPQESAIWVQRLLMPAVGLDGLKVALADYINCLEMLFSTIKRS